jgi:hypothetical protein
MQNSAIHVPEKCAKPLEDLETCAWSYLFLFAFALNLHARLLWDIHRCVEHEKDSGFLKMLFQKDARVFKIEAFQKRIGKLHKHCRMSSLCTMHAKDNPKIYVRGTGASTQSMGVTSNILKTS